MASDSTPSKGGGLSLYANLLDPSSNTSTPGTISRAPVVFKQASEDDSQTDDPAAKKQQLSAASLRFQPTKRPQLAAQKPKPKPALPKTTPAAASAPAPPVKTTLADWAATEDDDVNGFYVGEKRQRGGRKKRKKNREAQAFVQNWDDVYDPSRPNIYEEYKHSDEQIAEVREWKDRLYAHRMARSPSRNSYSDDESRPMNRQFAPPKSFAPPPNLNDIPPAPLDEATGDDAFARRARLTAGQSDTLMSVQTPPPPPPPPEEPSAPIPDDPTGEDAYLRRLQMAAATQPALQPPPPPPPRPLDALQPASATISRAPVRYTLPPPPEDIPATEAELEEVFAKEEPAEDVPDEEDGQRSLRPGQKGFAERLLAKYGWTKGSGLGATGSGIVKPLQVKVEKQKKRPDSEGGGFVTPAGRGKIIGGKRKADEEEGKFGRMSEVIILKGMLEGMDVDAELEGDQDGGLMQEIGEECSEKYGRVERVFISRESGPPVPVFVKFTNQLSALRAVNALEGRVFNGNTITARFYDTQKFEEGIYDDR
ncbi:DNA-damage-repair/toleration protein DRT111, chloroplastic [Aspergillus udagawae]|nr:DNA-damage-repair/toleration protein DRT111, chloroplastic [Aspergillus udagawae]